MSFSDFRNSENQNEMIAEKVIFLRHLLADKMLRDATQRAREIGVGAEECLVQKGYISEKVYYQELANVTGCAFLPEDWHSFDKDFLLKNLLQGDVPQTIVPLQSSRHSFTHVIAPRGQQIIELIKLARTSPESAKRFVLAPPSFLKRRLQIFLSNTNGPWL